MRDDDAFWAYFFKGFLMGQYLKYTVFFCVDQTSVLDDLTLILFVLRGRYNVFCGASM